MTIGLIISLITDVNRQPLIVMPEESWMVARADVSFGAESLSAGNSGICRVARLMARVIDDYLGGLSVTALT